MYDMDILIKTYIYSVYDVKVDYHNVYGFRYIVSDQDVAQLSWSS